MINKEYWDSFYKKDIAPKKESNFAQFVFDYTSINELNALQLIDVACGNGRDTFYFQKNGIQSSGVDLSISIGGNEPKFYQDNILDFDYSKFDLIYLRFIVHALKEDEFEQLLDTFSKLKNPVTVFIETRSSKGITDEDKSETFFKSSIGEEHFRMLYSQEYLTKKVEKDFNIISVQEGTGYSEYKGEDPVCLRYVLKNII